MYAEDDPPAGGERAAGRRSGYRVGLVSAVSALVARSAPHLSPRECVRTDKVRVCRATRAWPAVGDKPSNRCVRQDTGSRCSGSDRAIATSGVSLNFAPNMNFGGASKAYCAVGWRALLAALHRAVLRGAARRCAALCDAAPRHAAPFCAVPCWHLA